MYILKIYVVSMVRTQKNCAAKVWYDNCVGALRIMFVGRQ